MERDTQELEAALLEVVCKDDIPERKWLVVALRLLEFLECRDRSEVHFEEACKDCL